MNKVFWSRRNEEASLTLTPQLVSFLEGSVAFCFVLLIFFFFPFDVSSPKR